LTRTVRLAGALVLAALIAAVAAPPTRATANPPTITSFAPDGGRAGGTVTIEGTSFTGATDVRFNTTPSARFVVMSDIAINADVPAGATTGPISVTTPGGAALSASNFTVVQPITSFTPTSGRVGSSVTLSGTTFTGATSVRFNGVSASFTVSSDTAIQATVPTGATTGPLTVTTPGGTATSATNFTVMVPLTVNKASPLGIGNGTVRSSPDGINCGSACSADFGINTVVTLTVTPDLLSIFNGWSGCDTASGTTCTVTMSAARQVTANFLP
jgi:hypothetical protein